MHTFAEQVGFASVSPENYLFKGQQAQRHRQHIRRCRAHGADYPFSRTPIRHKEKNTIYTRLSLDSMVALNYFLAEEPSTAWVNGVTFSGLKADPGKPSQENVFSIIAQLKCLHGVALQSNFFREYL